MSPYRLTVALFASLLALVGSGACSSETGTPAAGGAPTSTGSGGATTVPPDGSTPPPDAASDAAPDAETEPPTSREPCPGENCWPAHDLVSPCGTTTIDEDFSTGLYNVHDYPLRAPAGVPIEVSAERTAGDWDPALIVQDEEGVTIHDGEIALSDDALAVDVIATGRGAGLASVRITAEVDRELSLFLTGWHVIDAEFLDEMPTDAAYTLTDVADCEPGTGLLSPPNFDPNDVDQDGYYLLPPSEPPGLYERAGEICSRGSKRLIDVLYTVAVRWHAIRPDLSPIHYGDLNEPSCTGLNHDTHDDGTHADVTVPCATYATCADEQPAVDLARLFVDTGVACGIIFDDDPVRAVVNPYFESLCSYPPWHGEFMRHIGSHATHFHIRVMTPEGDCAPL